MSRVKSRLFALMLALASGAGFVATRTAMGQILPVFCICKYAPQAHPGGIEPPIVDFEFSTTDPDSGDPYGDPELITLEPKAMDWLDCKLLNPPPCDRCSGCWTAVVDSLSCEDGVTWSPLASTGGVANSACQTNGVQLGTGAMQEWKVGSISFHCPNGSLRKFRVTYNSYNTNINGCPGDAVSSNSYTWQLGD